MKQFTFILLLFIILKVYAQESYFGEIKGNVIDRKTKQPIPFSSIYIKKLNLGTTSDDSGNFIINKVPEGKHNLFISFVGYQEKIITEVRIIRNKTSYINIELIESEFQLEEVEIKVFKYENISSMPTGTYSLSREEIFRSPASNGNIFKAISVIPGVQSGGGSFSALAVRGQGSEENAMYVDGFPIFELSHLSGGVGSGVSGGFDDPNGGRFSIFGPRVIDGLVIQTGGFSSLYGRKSSSYLGLDIKEGNPENSEIDIMGSLTGASINYSGPSLGKKNTLFTSFRYQNFVTALNLTNQGELGNPSFADFTFKNTFHLNKNNKLTTLILYNPEWFRRTTKHITKDNNLENMLLANVNNTKGLIGVKLRTLINRRDNWENLLYHRFKTTDLQFGKGYPKPNNENVKPTKDKIDFLNKGKLNNTENEIGLRSIYKLHLNKKINITSGIDISHVRLDHKRILKDKDTLYSFYRNELPLDQRNLNYFVFSPEIFNSKYKDQSNNVSIYTTIQFKPLQKLIVKA